MKPLSAPLPSARRREELFLRRPSPAASPATIFAVLFALLLTLPGCGSGPTAKPAPTPVPTVSGGATCSMAQQQPDQGNAHMNDLGHSYPFHPATSGPHYPVPLPPQPAVFTSEVPEARAVHNLEHGYVVVYFQSEGADSLPAASLEALRSAVPGERRTLLAPYHALPAG
ncbi:MAG: DUF3105 domain-containing protein, partial [Candidatus Dormibacteraeota bacterium]|nr:DUF3105 domain-containing protein [Candidatus Dormibacteraeota bacterium]